MANSSEEELRLAVDDAFENGDETEIRTAYTNLGLAYYARKRYIEAVDVFEEQVQFILQSKPSHYLDELELTALSFAYRLLSLVHGELGDPETSDAYNKRCSETEIDICLSMSNVDDADAQGQPPDFTALRDQLITNREEIAPMLLASPKFPAFLNAMVLFNDDVTQQVLQVVLTLLAQPYPKVHRRVCEHILTVVGELLSSIIQADTYGRAVNKMLKMSGVVMRLLLPRVPWAFSDRVPLEDIDVFIQKHVPGSSSLHTLWNDVLKAVYSKTKYEGRNSLDTGEGQSAASNPPKAPKRQNELVSVARRSHGYTRSPSQLTNTGSYTDTTTYSSADDGDTTTFVSLASDDDVATYCDDSSF